MEHNLEKAELFSIVLLDETTDIGPRFRFQIICGFSHIVRKKEILEKIKF